jgi:hypothetical protein
MITKSTFEMIKRKHGGHASWAVWGPIGATPKSGMGARKLGVTCPKIARLDREGST